MNLLRRPILSPGEAVLVWPPRGLHVRLRRPHVREAQAGFRLERLARVFVNNPGSALESGPSPDGFIVYASVVMVILDENEVLVRNNQFFPVDLTQNFRLQNLLRRPFGKELRLEQHQPVHPRPDHVNVVSDHENGQLQLLMQLLDQLHHAMLRGEVQSGRRLVQQENSGLLRQRPRDEHPLLLSTGKRPQGGFSVMIHADLGQRLTGDVPIFS
jgi:hypothetical protein